MILITQLFISLDADEATITLYDPVSGERILATTLSPIDFYNALAGNKGYSVDSKTDMIDSLERLTKKKKERKIEFALPCSILNANINRESIRAMARTFLPDEWAMEADEVSYYSKGSVPTGGFTAYKWE